MLLEAKKSGITTTWLCQKVLLHLLGSLLCQRRLCKKNFVRQAFGIFSLFSVLRGRIFIIKVSLICDVGGFSCLNIRMVFNLLHVRTEKFRFSEFLTEDIKSFKSKNVRRIWKNFAFWYGEISIFWIFNLELHIKTSNPSMWIKTEKFSTWNPKSDSIKAPAFSFFLLHVLRSLNPQGCLIFHFFLFQFSFFLNHTVSLVQEIDFSSLIFHSFVFCGEIDLFVLFVCNLLTQIS